jgi:predicted NAD/FAD-binding protein
MASNEAQSSQAISITPEIVAASSSITLAPLVTALPFLWQMVTSRPQSMNVRFSRRAFAPTFYFKTSLINSALIIKPDRIVQLRKAKFWRNIIRFDRSHAAIKPLLLARHPQADCCVIDAQ